VRKLVCVLKGGAKLSFLRSRYSDVWGSKGTVHSWRDPKGRAAGLQAPLRPKSRLKQNKEESFSKHAISNILRDLPFSRKKTATPADDYTSEFENIK
jgi:hypothetical protein